MKKSYREDEKLLGDTSYETVRNVSPGSHWILWLVLLFVILMLIWMSFAEIDEVTKAYGTVIPTEKVQTVQYLEGGIVQSVLVTEGEKVQKGQSLMIIDATRATAKLQEAQSQIQALRAKLTRLEAEVNNKPLVMPEEIAKAAPNLVNDEKLLYQSRQDELAAELEILEHQKFQKEEELRELKAQERQAARSYELVDTELKMTQPLVKEGAVSQVELLRLQRAANELAGDLESARIEIPRAAAAIKEVERRIYETRLSKRSEALDELSEARAQLLALNQSAIALSDVVKRTTIRSPVDGVVKQIYVDTIDAVVAPGKELIDIVPSSDSLIIEAKVSPSDIAFVHPGQDVKIQLSAYDHSIYGGLTGKLVHVGADTLMTNEGQSYYEVWAKADKNYLDFAGKQLYILPGMQATIDIKTGERTIMQYLMKPVIKAKQNAFGER